jgi:hypothetical protein
MDHSMHQGRPTGAALTRLAVSATLHCLTGCAIGEVPLLRSTARIKESRAARIQARRTSAAGRRVDESGVP